MINYLIVPGLGNSGDEHWQTYFERWDSRCVRIHQQEWDAPDCNDWIETMEQTVLKHPSESVILVGHSLGCVTIAHWAKRYEHSIRGAMLVAPSDIEAPAYDFPATGFTPITLDAIPFKTLVVASTNDPWVSIERATKFAESWGSKLVNIGDAGHINAASGHGPWTEGFELLRSM